LVSKWVGEIEAIDVSEVVLLGNELILNFVGCLVLVVPALSLGQCFVKVLSRIWTEILLLLVLFDVRTDLDQTLCSLLSLAMRTIVGMVLLELADICFPAEVGLVNERDGSISFVTSFVLMMSVESLVGSGANLSIGLKIYLLDGRGNNLVLRGDDGDLDSVRLGLHGDCFLHIVVGFLLTEEAYDFMVGHAVSLFADRWDGLDEPDHGLVTL